MSVHTIVDCDRSHAPAILDIFNDAIATTTALYEYHAWTPDYLETWFAAKDQGKYPVIGVVGGQGSLLGFASYGPFRLRAAYKYSIEHSVYVHPAHRGKGIGKALLAAIIERAQAQQYHVMVGGIDASNAVSIDLHKRFGFEPCGIVRQAGFKFGRWLDLAFYQLILKTPDHPVDG